jgi:HAD superfamily hydrolase (TIGR01509 family)
MNLRKCDYWVFDLDGTLTVAIHDFDAIRATLGLPPGQPILEAIAALPMEQANALSRRLDEIESEMASQAIPHPSAKQLLDRLQQRGARLGILTRGNESNACETLRVCGLLGFFEPTCILGRGAAAPKPDPGGVHQLLAYWGVGPSAAVVVGDHLFDLMAGHRAGTTTIYVGTDGDGQCMEYADARVQDLGELLTLAVG